jgi:hypothetical protein
MLPLPLLDDDKTGLAQQRSWSILESASRSEQWSLASYGCATGHESGMKTI